MATVMTQDEGEWRVACPLWQNIHSDRAEQIAERYDKKHDKNYKAQLNEREK